MNPTQQEIEEGNAIIAEGMGGRYFRQDNFANKDWVTFPEQSPSTFRLHELKYHTSWDWLMPVVIHISHEQAVFRMIIGNMGTVCKIDDTEIPINDRAHPEPIMAVWYTCVEFFKWKKEQKNK